MCIEKRAKATARVIENQKCRNRSASRRGFLGTSFRIVEIAWDCGKRRSWRGERLERFALEPAATFRRSASR